MNNTLPVTKLTSTENATAHEIETAFFSSVSRGDVDGVNTMIKMLLKSGIVTNKLSKDDTKPLKYWAINTIAIATRYAIIGGADETACYSFTDEAIMQIDSLTDESDISSSERGMGPETLYEFDFEYCCDSCLKSFGVKGYINEYPVGALNFEEIDTVEYENEDEEDDWWIQIIL